MTPFEKPKKGGSEIFKEGATLEGKIDMDLSLFLAKTVHFSVPLYFKSRILPNLQFISHFLRNFSVAFEW